MMSKKDNREELFVQAYDKYADAIFRYCYYRVFDREKAKDFVQDAFCKTWNYIAKGKKVDNIRAFLYKTANHIIIDDSRKKKSYSLNQIMEKGFSPSVDPRAKNERYFEGKEVLHAVESLGDKYRDVIMLKYVDDLSTKEISTLLGETENNVYVRISRGFEKLKHIVNNEGQSSARSA